jgi:hypothetical protein
MVEGMNSDKHDSLIKLRHKTFLGYKFRKFLNPSDTSFLKMYLGGSLTPSGLTVGSLLIPLLMTFNFTNILRAAFSYQSPLRSFYVLTIWVCNFVAEGFWRKSWS